MNSHFPNPNLTRLRAQRYKNLFLDINDCANDYIDQILKDLEQRKNDPPVDVIIK